MLAPSESHKLPYVCISDSVFCHRNILIEDLCPFGFRCGIKNQAPTVVPGGKAKYPS